MITLVHVPASRISAFQVAAVLEKRPETDGRVARGPAEVIALRDRWAPPAVSALVGLAPRPRLVRQNLDTVVTGLLGAILVVAGIALFTGSSLPGPVRTLAIGIGLPLVPPSVPAARAATAHPDLAAPTGGSPGSAGATGVLAGQVGPTSSARGAQVGTDPVQLFRPTCALLGVRDLAVQPCDGSSATGTQPAGSTTTDSAATAPAPAATSPARHSGTPGTATTTRKTGQGVNRTTHRYPGHGSRGGGSDHWSTSSGESRTATAVASDEPTAPLPDPAVAAPSGSETTGAPGGDGTESGTGSSESGPVPVVPVVPAVSTSAPVVADTPPAVTVTTSPTATTSLPASTGLPGAAGYQAGVGGAATTVAASPGTAGAQPAAAATPPDATSAGPSGQRGGGTPTTGWSDYR